MTKYRYTKDPKKMMTAKQLYDAIQNDYENIKEFLPCRTATYIEYEAGNTEALFWNEGEEKQKIFLPLEDGWYEVDENGIPNGEKSHNSSPTARYLCRYQNDDFSGPVGLGDYVGFDFVRRRSFNTYGDCSYDSGVKKISSEKIETP